MNYEEMSDFEINKAVHFRMIDEGVVKERYRLNEVDFVDVFRSEFGENAGPSVIAVMRYVKDGISDGYNPFGGAFDYCNNASDAWPIMDQYGIATIVENGVICGATNNPQEFYEPLGSVVHSHLNTNAIRAAMIVFLMMQE